MIRLDESRDQDWFAFDNRIGVKLHESPVLGSWGVL